MTIPLIVLAALSVLGGLLLLGDWIVDWLEPVVGHAEHHDPPIPIILITLITVAVVAAGVALAWVLVGKRDVPREAPQDVSFATKAARQDLYGDAINEGLVVQPTRTLVGGLLSVDKYGADGLFTGSAIGIGAIGGQLRKLQNGFVRSYALSILGGVLIVVLALLAVNWS
jgi:NADH-quinone oxidoreductase subunit L